MNNLNADLIKIKTNNFENYSEYRFERESGFYTKADISVSDQHVLNIIKKNEIEIKSIKKQLGGLCRQYFNENPIDIEYLKNKGTFHYIFRLTLPNKNKYIIKTSINNFPYRSYDFFIDKWVMNTFKANQLPCIEIYDVNISRIDVTFDYVLMDEAPGHPLTFWVEDKNNFNQSISQLGKVMAQFHTFSTEGYGPPDIKCILTQNKYMGLLKSWKDYICKNLEKDIEICFKVNYINSKEKEKIQEIFSETSNLLENCDPSLVHGDLGNNNIFFYEKSLSAIIDWEDCISGDSIFDLASWGTFIGNHEKLPILLEGYEKIKPLPVDFEKIYLLYYLRIILAKTVHRYRFEYYKTDMIPASERIIQPLKKLAKLI